MLDVFLKAIRDMRTTPVPGLVVEAALLSLCTNDGTVAAPPPVQKVVAPKEEPAPKVEAQPVKEEPKEEEEEIIEEQKEEIKEEKGEEAIKSAIIEAPELSIESIRESWTTVLNEATPSSVKMSLKNGRITDLDNNMITICFSSSFHRDKVRGVDASRTVEAIFEKIFKQKLGIHCKLDDDNKAPVEAAKPQEDIVNLADAAAEIF